MACMQTPTRTPLLATQRRFNQIRQGEWTLGLARRRLLLVLGVVERGDHCYFHEVVQAGYARY